MPIQACPQAPECGDEVHAVCADATPGHICGTGAPIGQEK